MSEIGKRIKERRSSLGLSADDLATVTGISAATIYRYENGQIESIPAAKLFLLARALHLSPVELMGGADTNEESRPENESVSTLIADINERLERLRGLVSTPDVSHDEKALIAQYRMLSDVQKIKLQAYLEGLLAGV